MSSSYYSSSSSSFSLFHCLVRILVGFCLALALILTALVVYYLNSNRLILFSSANTDQGVSSLAKKRQLPDFVNIDVDPCEHFYQFVCDKKTPPSKLERYEDNEKHALKWTHIRSRIHDKLMTNISNGQSRSSESTKKCFFFLFS